MMYRCDRLRNGLTVATVEMPHMASVSVGIWVGVGGRHEPAELNGASHFIEHLLFKGTRRRSAREISQAVEGVGGYVNAFTSEENTCYYAKACPDRAGEILDVLGDMFLNSTFAPGEIEKERGVIKEEVAMYLDQPQQQVQELLSETMWPGQALGRPLTGTEATLDRLGRRELVGYLRRNYVAPATLIVSAGQVSHEKMLGRVRRISRHFADRPRPRFAPARVEQEGPRVRLFARKTEQTQVAVGVRTCSRHDERRFALRLLNTVLGENMSSRLFQVVREDHGLAYSIYSSLSSFDDTGTLTISAGLETRRTVPALKLIFAELRRLKEKGVDRAELRRAREYVMGQMDLNLEGSENQMMWVGENLLSHGRVISPGEVRDRLGRVTAAELRRAACDFFRPERVSLAMVSPWKDEGRMRREIIL